MTRSARLHITHVANFYGPRSGGIRTTIQELGRGYRQAGHQFSAIVAGARDAVTEHDFGRLYTVAAPELPGSGGYRVILRRAAVRALLRAHPPDRLELSDRTTLHSLGSWARTRGIGSVFFAHERVDGVLQAAGLTPRLARRAADHRNGASARMFDVVVATTEYAAAEFARVHAGNVRRVPLGVDLVRFRPQAHEATDVVRLVLCSRLSTEKSPHLALETLVKLLQRGVPARLDIYGDGPCRPELAAAAAELPVRLHGFVNDRAHLATALAAADVALAPGPIETFGLAALECLAAGTPVVANAASAVPEVIGPDPAAARAVPGTAGAFADAVAELVRIPRPIRQTRARARAEQFPWSRTISDLLELHGCTPAPARSR